MKRFAQYIRVSTGPQAKKYGPTPENTRIAEFPLVGIVFCGHCGWRLQLAKYLKIGGYFRCQNYVCEGYGHPYHPYVKVEKLFLALVSGLAQGPTALPESNPRALRERTRGGLSRL